MCSTCSFLQNYDQYMMDSSGLHYKLESIFVHSIYPVFYHFSVSFVCIVPSIAFFYLFPSKDQETEVDITQSIIRVFPPGSPRYFSRLSHSQPFSQK